MKENGNMQIVACCDKGFVMPTGVMVYSVCVNNQDVDIDFHIVLDESVSEKDKNNLADTIHQFSGKKAFFYTVGSEQTKRFPLVNASNLTRATYYRLFLTEILPTSIDKILYLDGDIIVRHSLRPLWNTDISDYAVGAVIDWAEGHIEKYNRLRYPYHIGHFNAGVLLVNLDYWRKKNVIKDFMDYLNNYSDRIIHEDQDVMNVVFQNVKYKLPIKYNFQTGFLRNFPFWDYWKYEKEYKEALNDPVIVHFTEGCKPWYAYNRYPQPYRSTFYKYQDQTIWKNKQVRSGMIKRRVRVFISVILAKMRIMMPQKPIFIDVPPID